MAKPMSSDEADIAEKIARVLTERDELDDGEIQAFFSRPRAPGALRAPAACSARVFARDPLCSELAGEYEIEIVVRRRS